MSHASNESNPVSMVVWVTIGAVALIVGIILLTQLAVGTYGSRSMKDDPAMSDKAVAERLAPVAKLAIDPKAAAAPAEAPAGGAAKAPAAAAAPAPGAAPASAPAPAAAAPVKTADAGGGGKKTYDSVCGVCHGPGVAGAPKLGDKAAWGERLKAGQDSVYANALKGKGAMPPKGGNASLSDADVKAAVDYMLAAAK